ncbi:MAG: precorrin-4 C(11)-methyltransferase [Ruminococcus sp.]|nr:precorrin-4 C(11)-methyltransferase [Ruminococcus sp.]
MVNFVGAGCGAPDLITLRGKRLIEQADVLIYAGSLVNPELLDYARPDCEIHNSAFMTLEQVIGVMERARGKNVVRLHTGDPSVYGAIREQMDRLAELGIEYAICPGVSSFCGAAAVLRAEYTLPDVSQTVIITRMAGRTSVPERESIEKLSAHRATMVVFLSAGMTAELSEKLISGGYKPETPVAIVYKATWAEQKIIRCTVSTLAESARKSGINKTALITVGDFLGDDYSLSRLYDANFKTEYRK